MNPVYDPLSTDPEDFCFFDFETCSLPDVGERGDLKIVGGNVYSRSSFANIFTYAVGGDPVGIMALDDGFDKRLQWDDAPDRLKDFYERAQAGEAWFVAWNCAFDRQVWNAPESTFPGLRIGMTLDAMVQAASSGLPGKLEHAGRACGFGGKDSGGRLMSLFANWGGETPQTRPDLWEEYKLYGLKDTDLLRKVYFATRPLPRQEWEDYWVSERINDRGIAVDVGFARRAAAVADANLTRINADLADLTGNEVTAVTQIQRMTAWVYDRLPTTEARDIMVKEWDLENEDDLKPTKVSLAKDRIEALIAYFDAAGELNETDDITYAALEHRLYGGSASPAKFGKIVRMQHDGVLRGQYTFNGAAQTGRYSSRGVQIHNLMRRSLGAREEDFIQAVNAVELPDHAVA